LTFKNWIYVLKSQIPKIYTKNVYGFTEMIPNIFNTCCPTLNTVTTCIYEKKW